MLDRLLQTVAQGGAHSYADLTRILGVSEEFLQQMIEDLVRMGYLRAIGEGCRAKCEDCPLAGVCAVGGWGQIWSLTEKGSEFAQKLQ
jgi:hypothetical protein